jgi:hypothetical protein
MNMPVPPRFVYESDLAKYEVRDAQQRITASFEHYPNRYRLASSVGALQVEGEARRSPLRERSTHRLSTSKSWHGWDNWLGADTSS